jgi:hypothetical protein
MAFPGWVRDGVVLSVVADAMLAAMVRYGTVRIHPVDGISGIAALGFDVTVTGRPPNPHALLIFANCCGFIKIRSGCDR